MKNLLKKAGAFIFMFACVLSLSAQNFDKISNAIKSGDAAALSSYIEGNVEITVKGGSNSYSKSQAEMVLKSFLTSNQPRSFTIAHQGTSPEGSKYFIGSLVTSGGNFRTYVYAKIQGDNLVIQEIRFEDQ